MTARIKRLLALGLAVILLLGVGGYFRLARPVGRGPAGPPVSRMAFGKVWSTRPVQLVGLGDSVTAGFGATEGRSYFDRLVTNPPDEFADMQGLCLSRVLPQLTATNLAISGSTSPQHLKHQIPNLRRQPTNVLGLIVMTTGGNDIIHNYGHSPPSEGAMYGATFAQARPWIDNFERRLNTMIREITDRYPGGCHIFLANIYDPTDGYGDIANAGLPAWRDGMAILAAYNRILAACAQRHRHVHLVNLHDAFLGHGIHCTQFWRATYRSDDPHYWYHTNLEDPNDRGYDALRRLFLNAMASVLETNLSP